MTHHDLGQVGDLGLGQLRDEGHEVDVGEREDFVHDTLFPLERVVVGGEEACGLLGCGKEDAEVCGWCQLGPGVDVPSHSRTMPSTPPISTSSSLLAGAASQGSTLPLRPHLIRTAGSSDTGAVLAGLSRSPLSVRARRRRRWIVVGKGGTEMRAGSWFEREEIASPCSWV